MKGDGGGDLVAGEGIDDFADGLGSAVRFGSCGKEVKACPSIRGMLAGEPDRCFPADDENMFVEASGWRAGLSTGGKSKMGGADGAEGARGAEGGLGKADESTEFHQGLIVIAWILFRNEGGGDGAKFG